LIILLYPHARKVDREGIFLFIDIDMEVKMARHSRRGYRQERHREVRKPRRILNPEELKFKIFGLAGEIQHRSAWIPNWQDACDALDIVPKVILLEQYFRLFNTQSTWEERSAKLQSIRPALEKIAAKFGYTLIDRRESNG